jgi:hypothetical protein
MEGGVLEGSGLCAFGSAERRMGRFSPRFADSWATFGPPFAVCIRTQARMRRG